MEEIPIIGTIARVVTFRQYQHKEHNMQADLKIPEIQVENKEGNVLPDATKDLNDAIQKYTDLNFCFIFCHLLFHLRFDIFRNDSLIIRLVCKQVFKGNHFGVWEMSCISKQTPSLQHAGTLEKYRS